MFHSAGVPPDRAAIVKVLALDDVFVETCRVRNHFRRVHKLQGENVLFKFACSNDSVISHVAESIQCELHSFEQGCVGFDQP